MMKFISIVSILALSACATTNSQPKSVQTASITKSNTSTELASADCTALYDNYETTMAQYKPKKKSFFQKSLGVAGAVAGSSVVSSKLIGSGMNPSDLGKVHNGIGAAQTLSKTNDLSNLMNATSAIGASQQAYSYAANNGCDTNTLDKIAEKNT